MVCCLAKVISSLYWEWIENFEIQALSRVQDQCEKEQWGYIISLDCITSGWWETQDWKWGNLMVSGAQMEKRNNLALFFSCLHDHSNSWFFFLLSLLKWVFSHSVVIEGLHCLVKLPKITLSFWKLLSFLKWSIPILFQGNKGINLFFYLLLYKLDFILIFADAVLLQSERLHFI